jgi:hypothetical protein
MAEERKYIVMEHHGRNVFLLVEQRLARANVILATLTTVEEIPVDEIGVTRYVHPFARAVDIVTRRAREIDAVSFTMCEVDLIEAPLKWVPLSHEEQHELAFLDAERVTRLDEMAGIVARSVPGTRQWRRVL